LQQPHKSSKEVAADPLHYVDWLTLLGFMTEDDALKFVRMQNIGNASRTSDWVESIHLAREVAGRVSGRMECKPETKEISPEFRSRLSKLEAESMFKQHSAGMKSLSFALVELSKVHTFQTMINIEYANSLMANAPEADDLEGTLKFCLPTESERPKTPMTTSYNPNSNTFSAVTDNLDLRILGNTHTEDPVNHTPIAGFYYGFSLPHTTVVEYKGVMLLKNGCHRAYALLKKGHRFLPCLLGTTELFQVTGAQVPGTFPLSTIISDKSPILSDFDTDAAVAVPRRRVKVMATIHAEVQVVPI
jgi:hypothetical protein